MAVSVAAAPAAAPAGVAMPVVRRRLDRDDLMMRAGICLLIAWLLITLALPLWTLLSKSFRDQNGNFVGLANYTTYFSTPALFDSVWNSLFVALASTVIVLPLAFVYAYALQRSCMRWKGLFQALALIPILAPSLLPAISFIYLFGNQGVFKGVLGWFGLTTIYGMPGMVLAMTFSSFPHALMILLAALALSDARLYEVAEALGTSEWRKFMTITLPGAKYGLVSACMVVFTMAISEFGVPKVIGGNTSTLAVDIYKQVIGQQNFAIGAVVSLLLLLPAVIAYGIDMLMQRRAQALLTARSVPYSARAARGRDVSLLVFVVLIALALVLVVGMAAYGSLVKVWPYNLSLTLNHYTYGLQEAGLEHAYWNSLKLAAWCALLGSAITFTGAYWLEKTRGDQTSGFNALRPLIRFQAMLPMAIPGMVLGIGYILFFNHPQNPANFLYGTMTVLVTQGEGHFPISRRDPKPVVDFILSHQR